MRGRGNPVTLSEVWAKFGHDLAVVIAARTVNGDRTWTAVSVICEVETEDAAVALVNEANQQGAYLHSVRALFKAIQLLDPGLVRSEEELEYNLSSITFEGRAYALVVLRREPASLLEETETTDAG